MPLPNGVRRLFRLGQLRPQIRRDLDDELEFHFREAIRNLMSHGVTEAEATEMARARFGDEQAYRQTLERIDDGRVRMRERSERLDSIARTLALALRRIRRAPGFTTSVVVILALGIGANAVMFGVVDRLLLSPPAHVVDADDVRLLHVRREAFNGETHISQTITYPDFEDFFAVDAFVDVAAYAERNRKTVGRGEAAGQALVVGASPNLFPLLGVHPVLGRFFRRDDDLPEAIPTAVLAQEYWEREYGGDPGVLGRVIDVGAGRYTVIGIAPAGFTGAELAPVDIWLPIVVSESLDDGIGCLGSRGCYWLKAVARLAAGATTEAAEAEATAMHRSGRADMISEGRYDSNAEVVVAPIIAAQGPTPTSQARVARWLAGVSLIVLLIACLNVANLLLARSIHMRREIAVRLALGVSRQRLTFELVTESLVLATIGAAAALMVVRLLGGTVHQVLLPNVAFTDEGLSSRLLGFTLVATLAAGLLTGLIPALQGGTPHIADALKSGGRGVAGGRSKSRIVLLVGQAALSVVLLVGAGLFVRSLQTAQGVDLGFDAESVAVIMLEWNETLEGTERRAIYDQVLAGVRRLPGVRSAGLTYTVPFYSSISLGQPRIPGLDSIPRHHRGGPYANKVGSGFFDAMGLNILQGRAFISGDDSDDAPPVSVVSESMARAIWPGGNALGACMLLGDADEEVQCTEVVGIVENHRRQELVEDDPHFLYFLNQSHPAFLGPPQALVAGMIGDPETIVDLIRAEAATTSTQIRFVNAARLSDFVAPQLRSWKLGASMFTAMGILALIVAALGLYSVLAFDVALRHHELGIRSALGAGAARLIRLVLRQAITLVVAGVAIGLLASRAAARFVEPLLFRVSASDPAIYAGVAVTLVFVAVLAGSLPAWRATHADPREALGAD